MKELRFVGASLVTSMVVMKTVLPLLSNTKIRTKNNDIIRGKWHKKRYIKINSRNRQLKKRTRNSQKRC